MSDTDVKKSGAFLGIALHQESIVVAQNKNLELFVKNFRYESENITSKHLGQIFGFFEIPEMSDDNAYIVNFLASVVKKEYFQNPRRSANESFEAALHKVNLALTELVKQGNTSWLGKLEGAVAVIENGKLHFSVTGDSAIILYRNNEGTLISEGLADKDAANHPLKTFLEISSGQLLPGDILLFSSPELFSLCSEETLLKNVFRMNTEAFSRYIRAALVNELSLAASIVITVTEEQKKKTAPKRATVLEEASRVRLQNVFSGASFQSPQARPQPQQTNPDDSEAESTSTDDSEDVSEYTDQKTGHIYVQGDNQEHDYQEPSRVRALAEETWEAFKIAAGQQCKRWSKKSKKAALVHTRTLQEKAHLLHFHSLRVSRNTGYKLKEITLTFLEKQNRFFKNTLAAYQYRQAEKKRAREFSITQEPSFDWQPENTLVEEDASVNDFVISSGEVTKSDGHSTLSRLAAFSANVPRSAQKLPSSQKSIFSLVEQVFEQIATFLSLVPRSVTKMYQKGPKIILGVFIVIFIIGTTWWFWPTQNAEKVSSAPAATSPQTNTPPQDTTPPSQTLAVVSEYEGSLVDIVLTDSNTYLIQKNSVRTPNETWNYTDAGSFVAAAYMQDLRTIFLWTDQNSLISFSTVTNKFSSNSLPLPADVTVSQIGAYLTYLYVFDATKGTLYRFPRAEGGFTEGTTWLKTPLVDSAKVRMSVNDTIRFVGTTTEQYLKGVKEKTLSDKTFDEITLSSDGNFTLAANTNTGEIIIWNADGNTVIEKTLIEAKRVEQIGYDENSKKLLVARDGQVIELNLTW